MIDLTNEDPNNETKPIHSQKIKFENKKHATQHNNDESSIVVIDDIKIESETISEYTFPNTPINLQQIINAANEADSKKTKKRKTKEKRIPPTYNCGICNEILPTLYSLNKHHHNKHNSDGQKRQHNCRLCSQSFSKDNQLQQHISAHHSNVSVVCQQCDYHAFTKRDLWMHMEKHHRAEIETSNRSFKCNFCSVRFTRAESLKSHVKLQHIKQFPCEDCGHIITSKNSYYRHRQKHLNEKYNM